MQITAKPATWHVHQLNSWFSLHIWAVWSAFAWHSVGSHIKNPKQQHQTADASADLSLHWTHVILQILLHSSSVHRKQKHDTFWNTQMFGAGHCSSVGSASAWYADGCVFTSGKSILSWSLVMKYFLGPFSPFCWFKKGSYWLKYVHLLLVNCIGGLPRNSVRRLTDRARNNLKSVEGP